MSWTQTDAGRGYGDFAFGSLYEEVPSTSFGRYQGVDSGRNVHRFEGGGVIFNVTTSDIFRLHWENSDRMTKVHTGETGSPIGNDLFRTQQGFCLTSIPR